MSKMTDDEMLGLSPEERAALEEDDESTGEEEENPVEAAEKPQEASASEEDDEAAEDVAPAVEAAEAAPEPAPEPEAPARRDYDPFMPRFEAIPVQDYDKQMADLIERKKSLRTLYQEGEMTLDEYEDKRDAIDGEALALREANLKATMAREQTEQIAKQRWEWEQERFFADPRAAIYTPESLARKALNAAVIALAESPDNQSKPMSWFLEEADRQVRSLGAQFAPPAAPESKPAAAPSRKAKPAVTVPPNLGDLPSAELPETSRDEWSHLDRLNGMELEQALAKMSLVDQERYLRS